jgi:hypothetical protein
VTRATDGDSVGTVCIGGAAGSHNGPSEGIASGRRLRAEFARADGFQTRAKRKHKPNFTFGLTSRFSRRGAAAEFAARLLNLLKQIDCADVAQVISNAFFSSSLGGLFLRRPKSEVERT